VAGDTELAIDSPIAWHVTIDSRSCGQLEVRLGDQLIGSGADQKPWESRLIRRAKPFVKQHGHIPQRLFGREFFLDLQLSRMDIIRLENDDLLRFRQLATAELRDNRQT
jgi:hypothetical protein